MAASIGVGVAVLIFNEDGEVLLLERLNNHGGGTWAPPGGWVDVVDDVAETPEEAAVREVREEVGLELDPARLERYVGGSAYGVTTPTVDGVHSYCVWLTYRLADGEGEVQLLEPGKASAVEWVPTQDVPYRDLFPHLAEYLNRYGL